MAKHPGGRPTDYNDDIADTICHRLMNGESLASICREPEMPNRSTVHLWIIKHPEFSNKYKEARDIQADVQVDEMDYLAKTMDDVQRARLIIDTRKWTASKLKPKKYGDKLDVTSDGKALPTPIINVQRNDES